MKKIYLVLVILLIYGCNNSEKKPEGNDPSLQTRLTEFLKANDDMNFEKVIDYIYPKLFDIVPRKQLLETMNESFNNTEVRIELDSLRIDTLYPVFQTGKGYYAKARYSMIMLMNFSPTEGDNSNEANESQNDLIAKSLAEKYGEGNVSTDTGTGVIKIRTSSLMVAVKDEQAKEWCFVNLKEDDPLINKLFSNEILDKLATYK